MQPTNNWQRFFDAHAGDYDNNCFTTDTQREIAFLLETLQLPQAASILDIGCGTGRHAVELAKRGFAVTGVDLSSGMLDQARAKAQQRGVEVRWIQSDARTFQLDCAFDAAICLCEGAMGLLGKADDPVFQPVDILRNIARHLKPQAMLVMTVLNGMRMLRKYSPEDVRKGSFDPVAITESSSHPPRPDQPAIDVRERGFVPTELRLMLELAQMETLQLRAGTAGSWKNQPPAMDEMEIMVIARKR